MGILILFAFHYLSHTYTITQFQMRENSTAKGLWVLSALCRVFGAVLAIAWNYEGVFGGASGTRERTVLTVLGFFLKE